MINGKSPIKQEKWNQINIHDCASRISEVLSEIANPEMVKNSILGFESDWPGISSVEIASVEGEIELVLNETLGNHPIKDLVTTRVNTILYGQT